MRSCGKARSGRLGGMSDDLDCTDPSTWPYWMKVEEVAQVLRVGKPVVERLVSGDPPVLRSVVLTTAPSAERRHRRICREDLLKLTAPTDDAGSSDGGA